MGEAHRLDPAFALQADAERPVLDPLECAHHLMAAAQKRVTVTKRRLALRRLDRVVRGLPPTVEGVQLFAAVQSLEQVGAIALEALP